MRSAPFVLASIAALAFAQPAFAGRTKADICHWTAAGFYNLLNVSVTSTVGIGHVHGALGRGTGAVAGRTGPVAEHGASNRSGLRSALGLPARRVGRPLR
jgi:hypothetical protein